MYISDNSFFVVNINILGTLNEEYPIVSSACYLGLLIHMVSITFTSLSIMSVLEDFKYKRFLLIQESKFIN